MLINVMLIKKHVAQVKTRKKQIETYNLVLITTVFEAIHSHNQSQSFTTTSAYFRHFSFYYNMRVNRCVCLPQPQKPLVVNIGHYSCEQHLILSLIFLSVRYYPNSVNKLWCNSDICGNLYPMKYSINLKITNAQHNNWQSAVTHQVCTG